MSGQRNLAAEVERWCLDRGLGRDPQAQQTLVERLTGRELTRADYALAGRRQS